MDIFWSAVVFLFGLVVGSFINVVVLRLNTGESIIFTFSRCFSCSKRLGAGELIPVLSFIIQRGRCRHCGSSISFQYPVVESLSGLLFFLIFLKLGYDIAGGGVFSIISSALVFLFFAVLLAAAVYDARNKMLPDIFTSTLTASAAVYSLLGGVFFYDMLAGLGAFLFFALFWFVSGGKWMGFGDAKLAFGLGIFLGWPLVIVAVLLGFWIGAIWGILFLLLGKYGRKTQIPFGPFLATGAFLAFLLGKDMIAWYNHLIDFT